MSPSAIRKGEVLHLFRKTKSALSGIIRAQLIFVLAQTGRKEFGRMNLNTAWYWETQARKIALQELEKSRTLK